MSINLERSTKLKDARLWYDMIYVIRFFKKKSIWNKSNAANSIYVDYCPNSSFMENGNNAAILMDSCSTAYGIAQVNDTLPFVCEKSS